VADMLFVKNVLKNMKKPIRIQRKRTKGWKMPKNTIYVGRPTKYGNPYKITENSLAGRLSSLARYEDRLRDMRVYRPELFQTIFKDLKGKNLACWCPLSQPCHADILLELVN
jgi:hypothetical protein